MATQPSSTNPVVNGDERREMYLKAVNNASFGDEVLSADVINQQYPLLGAIMFCKYYSDKPAGCADTDIAPQFLAFVSRVNRSDNALSFPLLDTNSISRGWSKNSLGQIVSEKIEKDTLRTYKSIGEDNVKSFEPYWDRLFRDRLYAVRTATSQPAHVSAALGDDFVDLMHMDVWHIDGNGDLVKKVNGRVVKFDENNEDTVKMLKKSQSCYTTNVSEAECVNVMQKCIIDHDPAKLEECIKAMNMTSDLADKMKREIKSVHPLVALRILENFGFKQCEKYDVAAGMKLNKIVSVAEWKNKHLKEYIGDKAKAESIKSQVTGALEQYLSLLVQFVNANPGLLNTNYKGETDEVAGTFAQTEFAVQAGLTTMGAPLRHRELSRLPMLIKQQQQLAYSPHAYFVRTASGYAPALGDVHVAPRMVYRHGVMAGGAVGAIMNIDEQVFRSGDLLRNIFKTLIAELKKRNKTLATKDEEKINEWIESICNMQKKVIHLTAFIEEYIRCLDVNGNRASQVVNVDGLQKYVEKHCQCLQKLGDRTAYVTKVLVECEKACYDEECDNVVY